MKVRPLYDRILVKRVEEESKTAGGLFIPDTAKEKPQQGVIVAVGKGKLQEDGSLRSWKSRRATRSCSPSTRAATSRWMASST